MILPSIAVYELETDSKDLFHKMRSSPYYLYDILLKHHSLRLCECGHSFVLPLVTLNAESLESAESSPMQYNNSALKLSFFGK